MYAAHREMVTLLIKHESLAIKSGALKEKKKLNAGFKNINVYLLVFGVKAIIFLSLCMRINVLWLCWPL